MRTAIHKYGIIPVWLSFVCAYSTVRTHHIRWPGVVMLYFPCVTELRIACLLCAYEMNLGEICCAFKSLHIRASVAAAPHTAPYTLEPYAFGVRPKPFTNVTQKARAFARSKRQTSREIRTNVLYVYVCIYVRRAALPSPPRMLLPPPLVAGEMAFH